MRRKRGVSLDDNTKTIVAFLHAMLEIHDVSHEITGPCVFQIHDGGEVVRTIALHRGDGDWGELFVLDEDGTRHQLDLTGPTRMTYPTLVDLCNGLSQELFLADTSKYAVHPWEKDDDISVVVLKRGFQVGGPVYLGHPLAEVQAALDIIGRERRKGRMLAFPGQNPTVAELAKDEN